MTPAELNDILAHEHPAAAALLSPLGRRAALPQGIPQQSEQARGCVRQATIGEITGGDGRPLTLPSIARHFTGLDPVQAFRYAPQRGLPGLRQAWRERLEREGELLLSQPVVCSGITHAMSLVADLFSSEATPVIVAEPYWDNYDNIFTLRTGAPITTFPFYDGGRYNVAGLRDTLATLTGPAVLILNFPANPTGYSPVRSEVAGIVAAITQHPLPLCVVCDDAYQGLFFEADVYDKSLFGPLSRAADPARTLVCKVDGATKELVFFGGRVGFLTFSAPGRAGEALAEKAAVIVRSTISSASAPAQSAVLSALKSPTIAAEQQSVHAILKARYRALMTALRDAGLDPAPCNSGCFAMIRLPDHLDADAVRRRLISEQSVGTVSIPSANGIRIAFCSMEAEEIPDLVRRIAEVVR